MGDKNRLLSLNRDEELGLLILRRLQMKIFWNLPDATFISNTRISDNPFLAFNSTSTKISFSIFKIFLILPLLP